MSNLEEEEKEKKGNISKNGRVHESPKTHLLIHHSKILGILIKNEKKEPEWDAGEPELKGLPWVAS